MPIHSAPIIPLLVEYYPEFEINYFIHRYYNDDITMSL
jgi:hypothetical protein